MNISDNAVAILTMFIIMMVPIVAIFTKHQQKMAWILRQGDQGQAGSVERLAGEVSELRAIVTQQAIAIDNLADSQRRLAASIQHAPVAERYNV